MACQQVPEMYLTRRTLHCLDIGWRASVSACQCFCVSVFLCFCVCVWASPEYDHVHPLRSLSAWHGWEKVKWKNKLWKEIIKDTFPTEQSVFLVWLYIFRFTTPHHREGFELFLDTIVAMEDVWLVSTSTILTHIFNDKQMIYKDRWNVGLANNTTISQYQVSAWQTIQWMRDPQPIERAEAFPPFQCDYKVIISGCKCI